ncbi:MAG: bifunctional phosphopantothenoylcysteine decarboxylase/phosphopantothenate--cysteine ligase CoaBC [Flavobacteriales bacterium]|nr:bifunctional phosphopantothenoylcysteine decarboxylase/phosphopantothenate--cysteine ligase CoaBC [Flavobacteriales bacterium]
MLKGKNILLGISGGIASYKIATLTRLLKKSGANIKVVMTPAAKEFITPLTLSTLSENPVYSSFADKQTGEWNSHVELGLWADVMVVAPATANTIAKMANGICDNLLLATYLSAKCPVFVAPAMDLDMYLHPTTTKNINTLKEFGYTIIDAVDGELASGLVGKGRMEEPEKIAELLRDFFKSEQLLKGKKVLITAGPTYEQIDPVRFIGNNSSGKMGVELAKKALDLGADVTLVIGPNKQVKVDGINWIDVKSAEEMYNQVHKHVKKADIVIMSAAVADFKPKKVSKQKIKKNNADLIIDLEPTQDILKSVGNIKTKNQLLVGFALESNNELENAKTKLKSKNLDLIVLNSLNDKGAGFEFDTNKVSIIDNSNKVDKFELKSKSEVAHDIFNKIVSLLK